MLRQAFVTPGFPLSRDSAAAARGECVTPGFRSDGHLRLVARSRQSLVRVPMHLSPACPSARRLPWATPNSPRPVNTAIRGTARTGTGELDDWSTFLQIGVEPTPALEPGPLHYEHPKRSFDSVRCPANKLTGQSAGLLIPRSLVRFQPGPFEKFLQMATSRVTALHSCRLPVRVQYGHNVRPERRLPFSRPGVCAPHAPSAHRCRSSP
jgi:hypothetical protein